MTLLKLQLLETEQYYYHNEKMFNKLLKNKFAKKAKFVRSFTRHRFWNFD